MKWQFEVSDHPKNPAYPVIGTQHLDNGIKRGPFYFTMDDFIAAMKAEPINEVEEISTPPLPLGTIRYSSNKSGERQRITIEVPKKQWLIRYGDEDNQFYTIGFPRMIVQFLTAPIVGKEQSRIVDTYIHAVLDNKRPITDTTELYSFPFPNVWKDDGRVCWGSNERLVINEVVELERIFNWFIAAPFGEDLGVKTTHGMPNFKHLIEVIKDKEFDDNWLMPDMRKSTFGELFPTN